MSLPSLVHSHVFGCNSKVSNNLIFLDDQTVIYPSGTQIIFYEIDQKTQKFLSVNEPDGISTMTIHSGAKSLAIAIKGSIPIEGEEESTYIKGAFIQIFDIKSLKKKKTLSVPHDVVIHEFVSLAYTRDAKYLLALSGSPDWTIYIWNLEKSKLQGSVKTTNAVNAVMRQITCNPFDQHYQVCLTGNGILRIYKYVDGTFKVLNQVKSEKNMLHHAWVTSTRIVIGTDDSKLLVFDSGELILEISYVLPNTSAHNDSIAQITCLVPYSNGILAGISTGVTVIFEKTEDAYLYKKNREYLLEDSEVNFISLNPTETMAVVSLKNGQLYSLAVELDPSKGDVIRGDRLMSSFHNGSILGMDVATHKPLIVTSGVDKSIRIWNYLDKSVEVIRYFTEEAQAVSFHPSGLYILAAFTRSLKFMTLLIDDIRPYWESNIPGCRDCQFSNGGQFFAAVLGSTIQIYNTWSFAIIGNFRGQDAKIKSVSWSKDDSYLLAAEMDGSISCWDMHNYKRDYYISGETVYLSYPCFTPDHKRIFALKNNGLIKELNESTDSRELDLSGRKSYLTMANSSDLMFAATLDGFIQTVKYPFTDVPNGTKISLNEYGAHGSNVMKMKISCDDQYLFSAGEDGLLWIFKIEDTHGRRRDRDWHFSDEILVTKSDLKENQKQMADLKQRVEEIKSQNDSQQKLKDLSFAKKIEDTIDKFKLEVKHLKDMGASLNDERDLNLVNHKAKMAGMKKDQEERLKEIKNSFEEKMNTELLKYQRLKDNARETNDMGKAQLKDIEVVHNSRVHDLSEYYRGRLQEKQDQISKCKSDMDRQALNHTENIRDIDEDIDQEYLQVQYQYAGKLKNEQDILREIEGENQSMKSEFDALSKLIDENKTDLTRMFTEEKRLQNVIRSLDKDIQGLRKEIQERDDTLQDKEKRIYDLRKKNQELEKFKFVLDYKIVELKKQIEPKEEDIKQLKQQIEEMSNELSTYVTKEVTLKTIVEDFRMKERAFRSEKNSEHLKYTFLRNLNMGIRRDVASVMRQRKDTHDLKKSLTQVYHKYRDLSPEQSLLSLMKNPSSLSNDPNGHASDELSRTTIEKTALITQGQMEKAKIARKQEALRFAKENAVLITELNFLTKKSVSMNARCSKLEAALGQKTNHEFVEFDPQDNVILSGSVSPAEYIVNELVLPPLHNGTYEK